jgi:type 1 glutamine amidotransferase
MGEKRALITWGGWDGHEPEKVAGVFRELLQKEGIECEVHHDLECLEDAEALKKLHVIVPIWTMSKISKEQCNAVCDAVAGGTGIAGCHGGMCDAFRENVQWQFLTGGNWVSHPGGADVEYTVNIKNGSSPIVEGIKDFKITSEQYYLHTDPANEVLATTRFPTVTWYHSSNRCADMPVVWTKRWGWGRVFYTSLGHHADSFDIPEASEMLRRGLVWAAEGKDIAIRDGLDAGDFASDKQMF